MTDAASLLDIRGLSVRIGGHGGVVRPISDVSLTVHEGGALGIVGESGSGKSMLLRSVMGLLPRGAEVVAGEIRFQGRDLLKLRPKERRGLRGTELAMIFQEPMTALNPVIRVGPQIAEGPATTLGLSRAQARERALELMEQVGIPDPARRYRAYPHELSGGLRQRAVIAIALACNPRLLLCDEPTTALDVTIQDQILRLLTRLRKEMNLTVVFVSHDLAVVGQMCSELAVMYAGHVMEEGRTREILDQPLHPYTLGLSESIPDVDQVAGRLQAIPGAPPDLSRLPGGCPFRDRCSFEQKDCADADMQLRPVGHGRVSACIHHEVCVPHSESQKVG